LDEQVLPGRLLHHVPKTAAGVRAGPLESLPAWAMHNMAPPTQAGSRCRHESNVPARFLRARYGSRRSPRPTTSTRLLAVPSRRSMGFHDTHVPCPRSLAGCHIGKFHRLSLPQRFEGDMEDIRAVEEKAVPATVGWSPVPQSSLRFRAQTFPLPPSYSGSPALRGKKVMHDHSISSRHPSKDGFEAFEGEC
jgi:hypothetical protein